MRRFAFNVRVAYSNAPPFEYSLAMDMKRMEEIVVDAGFHLHRTIGPGLVEKFYHAVLVRELLRRGLYVESKKSISFDFHGMWFDDVLEADIVVERQIVIEIKAVPQILPIHYMQLRTYLRVMDLNTGFLMNFGEALFKNGVKRVQNEK